MRHHRRHGIRPWETDRKQFRHTADCRKIGNIEEIENKQCFFDNKNKKESNKHNKTRHF